MPHFLPVVFRSLLIIYFIFILPVVVGILSGRSFGLLDRTPWKQFVDKQRAQVIEQSKMTVLNLYKPESFQVLFQWMQKPEEANLALLSYQVQYFEKLTEILPSPLVADAYAMLGFCYFHQGNTNLALQKYEKALELNPVFLSTYYNLAVLYFRDGKFEQASGLVSRMMAINPQLTFQVLATSKIYGDILRSQPAGDPSAEVKKTYAKAMRLLVISLYRLGKYPDMLNASRYAIESGFEPIEVFQYYEMLARVNPGDRKQVEQSPKTGEYAGQDLSVRLF